MCYFLTIPFFVMLYFRNRRTFYWASLAVIVINVVLNAAQVYHFNITGIVPMTPKSNYVYNAPWARMGTCQVGLAFSMLYFEYKHGTQDPSQQSKTGYMLLNWLKHFNVINSFIFL
jgi:magnesium-transporting ATPase (P-type)